MCPRICVDAARNWKQIAQSYGPQLSHLPTFLVNGRVQNAKKSWEHKTLTYLDCPSLGFDSSSTGDTAWWPMGPARHYTVHSCLISASVAFKHIAFSLQSRRCSSCYISIFIFFIFCKRNGQYRTHTMNYRNFPHNEHYSVFWQAVVAQMLSYCPFPVGAWVRSQATPCMIIVGQTGTLTGFSSITSVFPCQYHSINAPFSFIHLWPMLYNLNNWYQ